MKEALKLALEALEYWDVHGGLNQPTEEAITAIKEALAQDEASSSRGKQEPVVFCMHWEDRWGCNHYVDPKEPHPINAKPLYTTPQASVNEAPQEQQSCDRRTWVGLTEEEKELIVGRSCKKDSSHDDAERVAKAIEAKLKEKNT